MHYKMWWCLLALSAQIEFPSTDNSEKELLTRNLRDICARNDFCSFCDVFDALPRRLQPPHDTSATSIGQPVQHPCCPSGSLSCPNAASAVADGTRVREPTAFCRPSAAGGPPCPPAAEPRHPAARRLFRQRRAGIASGTARAGRRARPAAEAKPKRAQGSREVPPASAVRAPATSARRRPLIAAGLASLHSGDEARGGRGGQGGGARGRPKGRGRASERVRSDPVAATLAGFGQGQKLGGQGGQSELTKTHQARSLDVVASQSKAESEIPER